MNLLLKLYLKIFYKVRPIVRRFTYFGDRYLCPICRRTARKFVTAGLNEDVLTRLQVIGGPHRKNAECPWCLSSERTRLEFLYIQRHTNMLTDKNKVLHFAPEWGMMKLLSGNPNIDYHNGDISDNRTDSFLDVTNITYEDNEFDFVLINHVLEHVSDDTKALSEIYRVLKPGGHMLITVPISPIVETQEQPAASDRERLALFGQKDHVRIYGTDFTERLKKAGFIIQTYCARDNVSLEEIERYSLLIDETVYIGTKPM